MARILCTRNGKEAVIEGHDMGLCRINNGKSYMTRYVLERDGDRTLEFYSVVDPARCAGPHLGQARWEADCKNLALQGVTNAVLLLRDDGA